MHRSLFSPGLFTLLVLLLWSARPVALHGQMVSYGTGTWDADSLGNHRVVLDVSRSTDAVLAHIPWRRRDEKPETKEIIIVDSHSGLPVPNIARIEINREYSDLVFQPISGAGTYFVYYLPNVMSGRRNYPTVEYPEPESTAEKQWLERHRLTPESRPHRSWQTLPRAQVVEIQSIDAFNSFWPMEVIATASETDSLLAAHPDATYLLFPEDRQHPIKMYNDLPYRWIQSGAGGPFSGVALRGEFYAFQIGVYALRERIEDISVSFHPLSAGGSSYTIQDDVFTCFNLDGTDWTGSPFTKTVTVEPGTVQPLWCGVQVSEETLPGLYQSTIDVTPLGQETASFDFRLTITPDVIEASGDNEPWRHSRLRWLNSQLAADENIVAPYTPVSINNTTVHILGRSVDIDDTGFPEQIVSFFASEMTHLSDKSRAILTAPISLDIENQSGHILPWNSRDLQFVKETQGAIGWTTRNEAGLLTMDVDAEMEFDGNIEFLVKLRASDSVNVNDIRLRIPISADVAKYMMGMGNKGGFCPDELRWKWDVSKNQDGAWIGDVNAGLQFSLKDQHYSRPLNTNFYLLKPLVMPISWANDGKGGCTLSNSEEDTFLVECYSGERTIVAGDSLYFNFRLLITPFRTIDTGKQWRTRFFHAFEPVKEIKETGANVINVHHANAVNPYINYPFLRPDSMKAYIDEAHQIGMKVKIYYTVRELSNKAPEVFALRSLGDEILSYGPGGGFSWLQEHLGENYIAAWFVPPLKDAAIINSGVSRWHNYYVEGLNWLVKNVGIDGLYIDDVAFDRTTMKRVRKVLDRGREEALIDLHSANQYNERDGFINSANLYLEHFPYIDRLWFGEYFDYDGPPEYWLIEMSGIPFGLMGEMLQDGGNPWRGMIYGMTSRLPWAGDPRSLWEVWDEFGMEESDMIGYWVPDAPVRTNRPDVLVTTYVGVDRALIAVASWADESVNVHLSFDWETLGIDPERAHLWAPYIENFQDAADFSLYGPIRIDSGRGLLLRLNNN